PVAVGRGEPVGGAAAAVDEARRAAGRVRDDAVLVDPPGPYGEVDRLREQVGIVAPRRVERAPARHAEVLPGIRAGGEGSLRAASGEDRRTGDALRIVGPWIQPVRHGVEHAEGL